jgi:hypothetical protein
MTIEANLSLIARSRSGTLNPHEKIFSWGRAMKLPHPSQRKSHAANKQAGHNPKMVDSIGLHVDHVNHPAIPEIISVSSTGPLEIPSRTNH